MPLRLSVLFAAAAEAQTGYRAYPCGIAPNGVTAADLNGDGRADLVVANRDSNSLTILRSDGIGGFTVLPAVLFGNNNLSPLTTIAADLNRDGKMDVFVTSQTALLILPGNGDGTFQAARPVAGVSAITSVQAADFNGDGIPDLAVTNLVTNIFIPTGANLSIHLGNGDGTFQAPSFISLGFTPWAAVTIGDFNADRAPDVAVAIGQRLILLTNDGQAKFKMTSFPGPWNFAPGIATVDLNGDGVLDVVVAGQAAGLDIANAGEGLVTVMLGKNDGVFQTGSSIALPASAQSVTVADLNGDGRLDLAAGMNSVAFLAGRGDGTFKAGVPFGASGNTGYWTVADFAGSGRMGLAGTSAAAAGQEGKVLVLPEALWPSLDVLNVSGAGLGLGPLAPGSIATVFGSGLATRTEASPDGVPVLSLAGGSVVVTDATARMLPARLYYASPGQVNYLIPAATAAGIATVTIASNGIVAARSQIQIAPVAPGLCTLNAANLAAAYVTRVNPNGEQTIEQVYQRDASGNLVPAPIDLRSGGSTVYLTVFGTGIRNVANAGGVTAAVGPAFNLPVTYAGAQGLIEGLDQVNIRLPSGPGNPLTFQTSYRAALQVTVDGQPSNRVMLTIQ